MPQNVTHLRYEGDRVSSVPLTPGPTRSDRSLSEPLLRPGRDVIDGPIDGPPGPPDEFVNPSSPSFPSPDVVRRCMGHGGRQEQHGEREHASLSEAWHIFRPWNRSTLKLWATRTS